jgi:integrase
LIAYLEHDTPGVRDWVQIAAVCGLRQGEQFGRLKSEVDVSVLWAFIIPDAKHENEPKHIFIPPIARPAVLRQMQSPGPWFIPNPDNPREPFPVKRWYKSRFAKAVKALGLSCNWHSLRHTFASRMLLSGASTKTVAQAGGWKNEKMVAEVYGHLTKQHIIDAMEKAAEGNC